MPLPTLFPSRHSPASLKIAFCMHTGMGGSGIMATELAISLANLGHEIHIVGVRPPVRLQTRIKGVFFHEVSVTHYPVFEYPPYDHDLVGTLVEVCKTHKIDLLHVHYGIPHALAAINAKMILKQRGLSLAVLVTLHGTDATLIGSRKHLNSVVKFALNQADGLSAVSNSLKSIACQNFSLAPEDIQVIYNFARERPPSAEQVELNRATYNPDNLPILIHVSNFRPVKRIEDTVRIFQKVNAKHPCRLLFIGDGPERPRIEERIQSLGLEDHVEFLGHQHAPENFLTMSDIFLLQSEKESFGLSALEAMKQGVPVVTTDAGGLPELIGDNRFTFPIGNIKQASKLILTLLASEEERLAESNRVRERSERFNVTKITQDYLGLYQSLIDPT